MSDLKLVYTGQAVDLDLSGHRLNLVSGDAAVEQQLRTRLLFFREEWFLDQRLGIPYYRDILVKNPNLDLIRNIYKSAILETPGVASIGTITVAIDNATRTLNLTFDCVLDSGGTLTYSPFIIEI